MNGEIIRTLLLGIGNSILSDDGIGIFIAKKFQKTDLPEHIEIKYAETGGLDLLHIIQGFDKLVIVDAIKTGKPPGTLHVLNLDELPGLPLQHITMSHEIDLVTTLQLGQDILDMHMPREVIIFAIEALDVTTFSEELSIEVKEALPAIIQKVKDHLIS